MIPLVVYSFKEGIEIVSEIFTIIGIGALINAYRTEILGKRALNFQVMVECVSRYQPILAKLRTEPDSEDCINRYVSLTKEELIYIHRGYIDQQVAIEWIEGMITYLPVFDKQKKQINISKIDAEKAIAA